ncbi:hypothetical protein [Chitinimonas lacunae]|uniref:Uncharacterized protein n=1 Tax=Chitinimonas lacunae TaxID=1963018 RepID=A0ABV8MX73_9NEIS
MDEVLQPVPIPKVGEIKVVQVCEGEWWAARSVTEAVDAATKGIELDDDEFSRRYGDAREVAPAELRTLFLSDQSGREMSCAGVLQLMVDAGHPFPCRFATLERCD